MKFQATPLLMAVFCFYTGHWIFGLLFLLASIDDTV